MKSEMCLFSYDCTERNKTVTNALLEMNLKMNHLILLINTNVINVGVKREVIE